MVNHDFLTFGPVPSRRLGRSLGINNIPPKVCSYSCIYCQLGRTSNMQAQRKVFYNSYALLKSAETKVKDAKNKGEQIDYFTFVPDGEPTLDVNLAKVIKLLRPLKVKIAVISNASLIWQKDVRDDLCEADWVSLKIDAVSEDIWRRINRPYGTLQQDKIREGIEEFSRIFTGKLATETMLIKGVNDATEELEKIARFIAGLKNVKSYISIPTRPPAEKWAKSADEHAINRAYQAFKEKSIDTEYLIGYEGNAFSFTGNIAEDLLSITSVHPMRKEAVDQFLKKANGHWTIIDKLITEDKMIEIEYKGNRFYMRKI
ncbi:MAG: radical SAM protein [Candidatus Omnitrophica bacterium]|nr:radical SAM protein [Candidatus Omnitrophota bacterium]